MAKKKKILGLIEKGTVIDHIKAGNAIKVLEKLKISKTKYIISMIMNVPSKKLKRKDILKIEKLQLDPKKVAKKISKIAPKATINIIKNKKVFKKIRLPELLKKPKKSRC